MAARLTDSHIIRVDDLTQQPPPQLQCLIASCKGDLDRFWRVNSKNYTTLSAPDTDIDWVDEYELGDRWTSKKGV